MGEPADWYEVQQAADQYHCPPWELLKQPHFWIEAARARASAEAHARKPHGG